MESLRKIKFKSLRIKPYLEGRDEKGIEKAKATYEDLVDRFYQENEEMMAPQQYEAAKKDIEYFMQLVDLAYHYFEDMEGKGTKPLH